MTAMPTPFRRGKRRLLAAVHIPITLYMAYVAGLTLASSGHDNVGDALPLWLTYAWAAALIIGGALVLWGVLSEHTRRESAGHGFQLAGVVIYAVANFADSDPVALAVLAAVPLMRMQVLRNARRARKEALRLTQGGT